MTVLIKNYSDAFAVDCEHVLISVISFTVLFANLILICFMSAAYASPVANHLHLRVFAAFEQIIVPVLLFLALLLTRH